MLKNKSILITGGTGSFGKIFTKLTLEKFNPKKMQEAKKGVKIPHLKDFGERIIMEVFIFQILGAHSVLFKFEMEDETVKLKERLKSL